ncbi:MAG: hypothetical protein P4K94_11145 [Terracidiphilus sp.]|nr:hypothetical protein [Terracidiphilus sp.]
MGHILSEIFPFLGSVFEHWQIWLSGGGIGGFVVIGVALVEKLWGKSLSKRAHIYMFIIAFFLCACFLSWVDKDDALKSEHGGRISDNKNLQMQLNQCWWDKNQLSSQFQYKSGVVDTLANQNRDQQNTINNCQTQALKLLAPMPFKQTALTMLTYDPDPVQPLNRAEVMLLSNKSIEPVNMRVTCNREIAKLMFHILGKSPMTAGSQIRKAPNVIDLNIQSPPWDTDTGLWLRIDHEEPNNKFACTYTRQ